MKVLFVAGFGPIVRDVEESRKLYGDVLGLPLEGDESYLHTGAVAGDKHFALWPLSAASESCFGAQHWPEDVPVPQAWIEFEVEDVGQATRELQAHGHRILADKRVEPWGQTVSRFLSPEGLLVGVTYTPEMREGG